MWRHELVYIEDLAKPTRSEKKGEKEKKRIEDDGDE